MSCDTLIILSLKMNHKYANLAAILQTMDAHIILVQEPSKVLLVPSHSDTNPNGITIYGTINHSLWEMYLSPFTNPYPHIATFVKKLILSLFTISTIDSFTFYHSLGLSFSSSDLSFYLLNFYHHVLDKVLVSLTFLSHTSMIHFLLFYVATLTCIHTLGLPLIFPHLHGLIYLNSGSMNIPFFLWFQNTPLLTPVALISPLL